MRAAYVLAKPEEVTMDETLAFPRPATSDIYGYGQPGAEGMYLRDYFAAKAMQAIIIGNGADKCSLGLGAAKDAYAAADSMMEARSIAPQNTSEHP